MDKEMSHLMDLWGSWESVEKCQCKLCKRLLELRDASLTGDKK